MNSVRSRAEAGIGTVYRTAVFSHPNRLDSARGRPPLFLTTPVAARHCCRPLRGVATYQDVYKLTYVRGPSGILVMLAEELKKN
jgi:hypothetical protein